jgi:hypothetical protein
MTNKPLESWHKTILTVFSTLFFGMTFGLSFIVLGLGYNLLTAVGAGLLLGSGLFTFIILSYYLFTDGGGLE